MEKRTLIDHYEYYLLQAGIDVPVMLWVLGSFIASLAAGALIFFGTQIIGINEPIFALLGLFIVLDMMIGVPYLKGRRRIELIEESFPDALKQISDTLKTGATYEYALREVANSQYGPLSDEMKKVLRKLEEGENFENAMFSMSRVVESKLIRRVITIIVDTVRAGAALADILDDIAGDVREMNRIAQERKTKTILQVIFMVTAGIIVAPFIFGLVSVIVQFLITTSSQAGGLTGIRLLAIQNARDLIVLALKGYIFILAIATAVIVGVMRDGRVSKSLLYAPLLLLVAYMVFFVSRVVIGAFLGVSA
ncbi:MAG: type II secretion system F family protein [Candidatus Diapherotrites archaeon]|nr:type II secretion system F family protein [Candidatus Diapherotrites archaeon]MDZ4256586.1 type II secretion system F family protein [archaeon]